MGHGRVFEIAPGVFMDAERGAVIITDGEQALVIQVTAAEE